LEIFKDDNFRFLWTLTLNEAKFHLNFFMCIFPHFYPLIHSDCFMKFHNHVHGGFIHGANKIDKDRSLTKFHILFLRFIMFFINYWFLYRNLVISKKSRFQFVGFICFLDVFIEDFSRFNRYRTSCHQFISFFVLLIAFL
jgi:hypothetical protein